MKSIAELLCEKHDEGALAAAIRRQGIYFKDVHEHLIPCKPDSPEARTALEWLADNAAWPRNYDEAGRLDPLNWAYEMLDNKEEDPFCTAKYLPCFVFGWPENK